MIIKNGNYTKLEGYDFALFAARHEAPTPFTHFIVKWYLNPPCPLEGFKLNKQGDLIKIFKRDAITNAYSVKTMGKYKGEVFQLWGYNKNRNVIGLITHNIETAKKLNFLNLSDRYIKEVKPEELSVIWEERGKSEFDLPIPDNLERKKIIPFRRGLPPPTAIKLDGN